MDPLRGGWSEADRAKPAADYSIQYGHALLEEHSSWWPPFVVVTTPSAHEAARPHFNRKPAGVVYARWLDWGHLEERAGGLPAAELVAGLGAGMALDASKYVALKKGLPLVVVPTVVETGAIIHGFFVKWDGRRIIGEKGGWPWVDYDVVLKAPRHLNTAGLGDVLCSYSGITSWRHNAARGEGPPVDDAATATTMAQLNGIVDRFPSTLGPDGSLTVDSVRLIMTAIQERDGKLLRHPRRAGRGSSPLAGCGADQRRGMGTRRDGGAGSPHRCLALRADRRHLRLLAGPMRRPAPADRSRGEPRLTPQGTRVRANFPGGPWRRIDPQEGPGFGGSFRCALDLSRVLDLSRTSPGPTREPVHTGPRPVSL